jgi:hypothetical protein
MAADVEQAGEALVDQVEAAVAHMQERLAPEPGEKPPPDPWSFSAEVALFAEGVATSNTENSRDATIAGSSDSLAFRGRLRLEVAYADGPWEWDNRLHLAYGLRLGEADDGVSESRDEIRLETDLRQTIDARSFVYAGGELETVFSATERQRRLYPEAYEPVFDAWFGAAVRPQVLPGTELLVDEPFDPATGSLQAGYGRRYRALLLDTDEFTLRAGVVLEQTWGRALDAGRRELVAGPEVRLRYEHSLTDRVDWFIGYSASAPFDDLGNVRHLALAGAEVHVTDYLRASLDLRAYYEHRPRGLEPMEDDGYEIWSLRNDLALGLVYTF